MRCKYGYDNNNNNSLTSQSNIKNKYQSSITSLPSIILPSFKETNNNNYIPPIIEHFNEPKMKRRKLNINDNKNDISKNIICCTKKQKNKTKILCHLSDDLICYIIEYITINDYCFSILQINKHFMNEYGPNNKSFIMNKLIMNECKKQLFGQAFAEQSEWNAFNPDVVQYIKKYEVQIISLFNSWRICGSYSWTNVDRTALSKEENEKYYTVLKRIKENDLKSQENREKDLNFLESLSISSARYLLNFMYLCRYGGISRTPQLKQLLFQCIGSGKGALGIRYMFYFYIKEFFVDKINKKTDIMINIGNGEIKEKDPYKTMNKCRIGKFLQKLYFKGEQETLFEFVDVFTNRKLNVDFYDITTSGGSDSGKDPFCTIQCWADFINMKLKIFWRIYNEYNPNLIKNDKSIGNARTLEMIRKCQGWKG